MSVRTAKLATWYSSGAGWVTLQTVPDGETWIVKNVGVINADAAGNEIYVSCWDQGGSPQQHLVHETVAYGVNVEWQGWVVMEPGDQLRAYSSVGNAMAWVSGSRLLGVA